MTLEGYDVLTIMPDFAAPPAFRASMMVDRIAMGAANEVVSFRGKHPVHVLHHRFLCSGTTEIRALEDFFFDHAGKWGGFWVPSWHCDLEPTADLPSGLASLEIAACDYANTYRVATSPITRLGNYLFMLHQDGTLWLPKVTGVSGTSPHILTLHENAAKTWTVGEFIVGFLHYVRFLNDELELTYSGPSVAIADLAMQEIIDVTSDADDMGDPPIEGFMFYDEFDTYSIGQSSNLSRGYGWSAAWQQARADSKTMVAFDDLSSYTAASNVNGTASVGDGFTGNWVAG